MQGSLLLQQWQRGHLSQVTYQPPSTSKKPSWVFISAKSATAIQYSFPEFLYSPNSESQDFHCHRQSGVWSWLASFCHLRTYLIPILPAEKLVLPWRYNLKPNNSLMVHILVSQKNHHYLGSFCFSYFWEKWKFSMSSTFLVSFWGLSTAFGLTKKLGVPQFCLKSYSKWDTNAELKLWQLT